MLINDTTFLLDESVDTLKNIRDTQELMANTVEWEKQPREARTSRQRQLATDERQCKSYLTLATETVDMLHYLTLEIKQPFFQEVSSNHANVFIRVFLLFQLCPYTFICYYFCFFRNLLSVYQ